MQKNQLYCSNHSWNKDDSLIAITLDMSEHAWPHPFKMTAYICLFYRCLTKFKNSTLYLNSFMRYNSSKNPGFWLVCGFWDHKSRIRFFPDMPFFTPFLGLFGPPDPTRLFFKNWTWLFFLLYDYLTLCKKSAKTDEPVLRFWVSKRWKADGQSQIHRALPLALVSKHLELI